MKLPQILALTLLATCLLCGSAFADLFSVSVSPVVDDVWEYTLWNYDAVNEYRVIELYLVWDELESPGPDIAIAGSPDLGDWIDDTDGKTYASWANIAGGENEHPFGLEYLSGFVVESTTWMPLFYVGFYHVDNPFEWLYTFPQPVEHVIPEPTSLFVVGSAIVFAIPAIKRRRTR